MVVGYHHFRKPPYDEMWVGLILSSSNVNSHLRAPQVQAKLSLAQAAQACHLEEQQHSNGEKLVMFHETLVIL